MDYKETLNLPQTDFPMKAGLNQLEPKILKRWQAIDLYSLILDKKKNRPLWVLHDGPPYANGHIHMGTALNKILKDIIIKSKTMSGYLSPYVPGWDCHGLPIEHQVDQKLGSKKNELSRSEIRKLCREYAQNFVNIQREEFKRLGVLGEWDNPYLTMNYRYEAVIARELGEMALSGRIYHSLKPVLWCGSCRTALAEAEVEYESHVSESIFVPFKLLSPPEILSPKFKNLPLELVIWTTTPWTIPANMAVAYNPNFTYAAYRFGERVLLVARTLAPSLWPKFNLGEPEDLGDADQSKLKGLVCSHPFYKRRSKVVPASYVTLEQGTGLVHIAPGHGREDYETGLAYELPILSPLDDSARYTPDMGELAGLKVLQADSKVIELLKEKGALLAQEKLTHQYPHCWRCKKPVVFRSTPQWFVSMEREELRTESLNFIDRVEWIPRWGKERIKGMIENRPDWCISRQRSWGVPITVFFCQKCGHWHYSQAIQNRLFELINQNGADVWYELSERELLPLGERCQRCGGEEFIKEKDILDVWFDSGCSFAAVCEDRDNLPDKPKMFLEGSDQHRGWFHSSLLISVANRQKAPYQEVLTHGYVVDGSGRKMSKSLNNTIEPEQVIKKYGADILRLWVSAENYQDDIRLSNAIMDMLSKAYFNFRNSARFILGNLFDFNPQIDSVNYNGLGLLDRYVLFKLDELITKVLDSYKRYQFHEIYQNINKFVVFLSSLYHDVVKDRLYTLKKDDPKRRSSQTVMNLVLITITKLMAPIISFTAEEIWTRLYPGEKSSVFLEDFPSTDPKWAKLAELEDFEKLLALRSKANKSLEEARGEKIIGAPIEAQITLIASGEDFKILSNYEDLSELLIVSEVKLIEGPANSELKIEVKPCPYPKCPRCWLRREEVPIDSSKPCHKCQNALVKA
ncbi:MAG: isoleucine--tRNA ligase [Deltaproteobacteria bacterium]|jgi:isoleucyl-tRNA synthetase|nr:isoleucine--tRNA ligase [Deltaproteobacteria bacterium]